MIDRFILSHRHTVPSASIPDLKPSSGVDDPMFTPPGSAVAMNLLWFWSLGISLTCAVMARMLQQWARQDVTLTLGTTTPSRIAGSDSRIVRRQH